MSQHGMFRIPYSFTHLALWRPLLTLPRYRRLYVHPPCEIGITHVGGTIMSTQAGFDESPLHRLLPSPQPRGGNKRKRAATSGQGGNRVAPMARRGQMGNHGMDQGALLHDLGDHDIFAGSGSTYLPTLAPHPISPSQGTGDSTVDTAAQALNFSRSVPPHQHDGFLADNGLAGVDPGTYPSNDGEGSPVDQSERVETQETEPQTPVVSTKPQTGSDEWVRQRKDNHKEGMRCF